MPRIPQHFLDDLLGRTDIVALIGGRIQLKKAGRDWQACCPFHNEKTPSFTVSPTKQFYHCFGCGAHGNALRFLMEYDRLEFLDAVETLAHHAGVEVPREAGSVDTGRSDNKPLYALMEAAARFYRDQLRTDRRAIDYLKGRGLSGKIAKDFGIGYAPAGWSNLLGQLKDEKLAVTSGMAIRKDDGGQETKLYDRFRDRIMFPIRDTRGRVVAFGGRTLGDDTPKYLNSPETPIFHKGRTLYGLYEARQALREIPRLLVVEGYMDVVALAQHGIAYAVATLGTATTEEHLELLFRSSSELVFCFDGDRAGREAGWRALERALSVMRDGREVKFLFLPDGEDPDTLVRQEGHVAFEQRLKNALPLSRYLLEQLSGKTSLGSADGRARLIELARPHVLKLQPGAFRKLLTSEVAKLARMPAGDVEVLYFGDAPRGRGASPRTPSKTVRGLSRAGRALQLLLEYPELAQSVNSLESLRAVEVEGVQMLAEVIEFLQYSPHLHAGALLEHWQDREELAQLVALASGGLAIPAESDMARREFLNLIERLTAECDDQRIKALLGKDAQGGLAPTETRELADLLQRRNLGKPAK